MLRRHQHSRFERPLPDHALRELDAIGSALREHGGPLVLDSGCGTGESSFALARGHTESLVLGVDKSAARLMRATGRGARPRNLIFSQLDLRDLWPAAYARQWPVVKHYLLYPNPWPKQHQLMRRWHAHAIMPTLLALSGTVELRTNWRIYADEFAYAANFLAALTTEVEAWHPATPMTAFERKYSESGHALYRVRLSAGRTVPNRGSA